MRTRIVPRFVKPRFPNIRRIEAVRAPGFSIAPLMNFSGLRTTPTGGAPVFLTLPVPRDPVADPAERVA